MLQVRLQKELRTNTYDVNTKEMKVSEIRADAIREVGKYYAGLFMNDASLAKTRDAYSIPENTIKDNDRMDKMNNFFFWTSWACVTQRPDETISYTNNWPSDELVGNKPATALVFWTGFSVVMLLVGIGLLAYYHARSKENDVLEVTLPQNDPLSGSQPTPSMKATLKYFWVVTGLILVQIIIG